MLIECVSGKGWDGVAKQIGGLRDDAILMCLLPYKQYGLCVTLRMIADTFSSKVAVKNEFGAKTKYIWGQIQNMHLQTHIN